jgi:hypothetical protein
MEWLSVSERLPSSFTQVVVRAKDGRLAVDEIREDYVNDASNKTVVVKSWCKFQSGAITHWAYPPDQSELTP